MSSTDAYAAHKRVLVDCDPAIGVRNRDLDDGLALLLLLASPVELEGLTINFGNVATDVGVSVPQDLLQRVGSSIPIVGGATSRHDLGVSNPAVDFLIDSVRAAPGEISLLALAPLTNVATAMTLDRTFAGNLREIVIMGGSFGFKPFKWVGEFNFHLDGAAAARVISAPVPKTLITMDVCSQAVVRQAQLDRVRTHTSEFATYLGDAIEPWLSLNRRVFRRAKGFFPWDGVAAAYLLDPSLFDSNAVAIDVQSSGLRSGRLGISDRGTTINAPTRLDADRFMTLFMDALISYC